MTTPEWRAGHVPGSPEYQARTERERQAEASTGDISLPENQNLRVHLADSRIIRVSGDGDVTEDGTRLSPPATAS